MADRLVLTLIFRFAGWRETGRVNAVEEVDGIVNVAELIRINKAKRAKTSEWETDGVSGCRDRSVGPRC